MDPKGKFNGDTLSIWWKAKENASSYFITVEQCHDFECKTPFKVVENILNSTEAGSMNWEETSSDHFGPCIDYNLKVSSMDNGLLMSIHLNRVRTGPGGSSP